MKTKSLSLLLSILLIGAAKFTPTLQASVCMSSGTNLFASRATYGTSASWALPAGDWTIGIWDNHFQGNDGWVINGAINLSYVYITGGSGTPFPQQGYYIASGTDSAGNLFGSGTTALNSAVGRLPLGYPGRVTGDFTPRLHIIRRNAGKSEYLVAEAGHAPVLVCSETRTFGATTGGWSLACQNGSAQLYDADLEGFFAATAAVSDKDIALMAAGYKPSDVSSLSGNLALYFPLETASLSNPANPLLLPNLGSATTVGLNRKGASTLFADGPMLRGAVAENNTPAQVTEPTNVVALNSFQPYQVIRHLNGAANITFTGFDYGTGTADIQIHFIDVEHGTSTAWQTLKAGSAGGGAAIAATVPVPKGYWKTIEVQRVNGGTGNSSRPNRTWSHWAVGEVVAVWGDSIQGQIQGISRVGIVAPNGFTAKYPTPMPYYNTLPSDTNPLSDGMWNLLQGGGVGGGSQGENEIANNLSEASQCCVGIMVAWAGATRLAIWNGRVSSGDYDLAKTYSMANGGLNKPSVITWVGNLASANAGDDFYADLNLFKTKLDTDFGAGTWNLILAPMSIVYTGGSPLNFHPLRDQCRRWTRDNPTIGQFAGVFIDHETYDGTHPNDAAWYMMGPRWGNAAGYLRDQLNYADPRVGEITSFSRSGANLIAQVQLYAGTALSLKNPGANITGFTLSSDNFATTIPISSAALIDSMSFRITPSSMPAGALKLRYLYQRPGVSGTTLAQMGVDNILYVNAGPTNIMAIEPIWGTSANNWSLAESGTSTLTPQTITFNALAAKAYGDAAFTLSATASSGLPVSFSSGNTAVATVNGSTLTVVGAGSAVITASQAGNGTYAAAPNVNQTLTVSKKALTVKANDKSRAFGAANPAFDATYTGLVNGDTSSSIGLTVTFSCAATGTSAAGSYPITPSGAASTTNYTVAYQNGTLTVTSSGVPAAPTGLTATAGNAQVVLNWTASTGATSYNVYRGTTAGGESTTPVLSGITTTSCANAGLTNGTAYYYKVAAVNASGTSGYSNEAAATPAVVSYVVDEGFTDGARTNGTDALDAAWYTLGTPTVAVVDDSAGIGSGNALELTPAVTGTGRGIVASIPTVTLADGDSVTVSFDWRFVGTTGLNQANSLRYGLHSSNATPTTADNTTQSDNDKGYFIMTNPGVSGTNGTTLKRESGGSPGVLGGTDWANLTVSAAGANVSSGTTKHTATLTITHSGTTVVVTTNIDGLAAATGTDSNPVTYSFDQFAITLAGATAPSAIRIDNLRVR